MERYNTLISNILLLLIPFSSMVLAHASDTAKKPIPHYYCTASDKKFFHMLLNMIGSIHKHDQVVKTIFVYDLGLKPEQKKKLETIHAVVMCEVEHVNPHILEPISYEGSQTTKLGAYSWKPVAIKQTLERCPYFFWIDAGLELANSIDGLFEYLLDSGYLLHNSAPPFHIRLERMLNPYVRSKFGVTEQELEQCGLEGGFIGVTMKIWDSLILPMYKAAHDINNFLDFGVRGRRHDQALFSFFAIRNGLTIHQHTDQPISLVGKNGKLYNFQYHGIPQPNTTPTVQTSWTRLRGTVYHYDNIRYKSTNISK